MPEDRAAPPRDDEGVAFPVVDGRRSTTATGTAVFADAARPIAPTLADAIAADEAWHRGYVGHVRRLVEAELRDSTASTEVPRAGLRSLHDRFEFRRNDEGVPVIEAITALGDERLKTVTVEGRRDEPDTELMVPYRGRELRGEELDAQLQSWVSDGVVEPSAANGIRALLEHPEWLDLRDLTVIELGAGSEMGPLAPLSAWGAEIVAVDIPHPAIWRRVLETVRAGAGRTHIPVRADAEPRTDDAIAASAGVDLITELPEVAAWLDGFPGPVTVGNHVYADGADNVRVSMAVDALVEHLVAERDVVSIAALATPTDVFAVPAAAVEESSRRFRSRGTVRGLVETATRGRLYAPNYDGTVTSDRGITYGIADAIIPQQGPNYLLAKRLHRWRARVAREDGLVSSMNVAPATRTRSVMSSRVLAAAYGAAHHYGVEIMDPGTSRALMAALLVRDLRDPTSAAHPDVALDHPLELFDDQACHVGLWRIPFAPRSVLGLAVVRGMLPGS